MLSTNTVLGKSLGGHEDLQSSTQLDPQRIEDYRLQYLQCASTPLQCLGLDLETYDELYQLGCDNPQMSQNIESLVSTELKLDGHSQNDRFNILFYGPYIQSQVRHHYLSENGAKELVRQQLKIRPTAISLEASPTTAA